MVGIYKITSPSGRVYIGQSWDIQRRLRDHSKPTSRCPKLRASFAKYGYEAHKFQVIHELPEDVSQEVMDTYEILYIDQYAACDFKMLNLKGGGASGKPCEESKERMRKSSPHRKVEHNEVTRKKIAEKLKGNKNGAGGKAWNKGIELSNETREKMSNSRKGNTNAKGAIPWNKGRTMSDEDRKALSERMKGIKYPNRKVSPEGLLRMSEAQKGKTLSEEHRRSISEGLNKYYSKSV